MTRDEQGSGLVETILLMLLLLVPIVWLVTSLARIHDGALAVTAAAREAGVAISRAVDPEQANASSELAVENALRNQGLDPTAVRIRVTGAATLARGTRFRVEVAYPVQVIALPVATNNVWVRSSHSATVDPYRSR